MLSLGHKLTSLHDFLAGDMMEHFFDGHGGGLENHGRLLPQPGSHSRLFSSHFIGQKKTQALSNFKRTRRHRGGAECVENITTSATAVIPAEVCFSAATPQWSLVCIFEQHIGILFPLLLFGLQGTYVQGERERERGQEKYQQICRGSCWN